MQVPEAPLRVVAITGAPGAGKSTVGRRLVERCPNGSVWVDTDHLAGVHPWVVNEALYDLIAANLAACLHNFREWGARLVVVSGVIVPEGTYPRLGPLMEDPVFDWQFYGLSVDRAELVRRIRQDPGIQEPEQRLAWTRLNDVLPEVPGCRILDTSGLEVDEVVERIAQAEGLASREPLVRPPLLELPLGEVRRVVARVLVRRGVPPDAASEVCDALVDGELAGHPSHGLVRLPEYVRDLERGTVSCNARPKVVALGDHLRVVEGERSFGILVARRVAEELVVLAEHQGIGVVAVRDSHHLGRLGEIGKHVAAAGQLCLGFVNYLGAGQKVPPWGGSEGRFCTNPLLFAAPVTNGDPIVVDMSTSTVAEGAVRIAAIHGHRTPLDWLVDASGLPVRDPSRLYHDPPTAFLTPLGGIGAGHKGYGLALMVEVLAGVVSGAQAIGPKPGPTGNGGLFLSFSPGLMGLPPQEVLDRIRALAEYCRGCPPIEGGEAVRLPGEGSAARTRRGLAEGRVVAVASLWEEIRALT